MTRYYGSDAVVSFLEEAGVQHVAMNPGATLRGLHDSLVHHESERPSLVLAPHEEIAVGIAHGYAKADGRPMAVFLHDLVGLQHASMAIFNAWCDNVPILLVGGSGPRDAARRRPWIDWVHTGLPQGSLVRDFVKWDDEPGSFDALLPSLARAWRVAQTRPAGPVYVSVDVELQEADVGTSVPEIELLNAPSGGLPDPAEVERVAGWLATASAPAVLVDRPQPGTMPLLVELAEQWALPVVDLGARCSFPTTHWASHSGPVRDVVAASDLLLCLELRDLAWPLSDLDVGTRRRAWRPADGTRIVSVGLTELQHRGFLSRESVVAQAHYIAASVPGFLASLNAAIAPPAPGRDDRERSLRDAHRNARAAWSRMASAAASSSPIAPAWLSQCLREAVSDGPWQLANGLLDGWLMRLWDVEDERQYLGRSGGEGLGYGMAASLGAALAARDSDTLVVNVQSDGDLLYTPSALWTAAHHRLPLLTVMHNNRCYGRDLTHQREIAALRGRADLTGARTGVVLDDPAVDFAALARAQGVEGVGPVADPAELPAVLARAAQVVRHERRPVLVDVVCVDPGAEPPGP